MDEALVSNLIENFKGKVATILTAPVSFPFKDAIQHSQYFTGKVVDINIYGIWLKHLHIDTYAFYSFPIIGIVEEQLIPDTDPRAQQIKEEIKQKETPKQPMGCGSHASQSSTFIPVDSLTKMVRDVKRG